MIVFIGITLGYGTGFIFNYNDHLLGLLTQAAASLDVDDNYKYSLLTDSYIRLISSIALAYFGTIIIEKLLVPKFTKKYLYEEEPLLVNKKAKKYTKPEECKTFYELVEFGKIRGYKPRLGCISS